MSVTLLHGDAIEMMATLPDGSVDMILCDPPYGQTQNQWDSVIPFAEMWKQVWRVCTGAAVFTAMQPFSSALVMSQVRCFRHEWVWEKNKATGHLNAKKAPMRAHEVVLVFSEGATPYYPQMTDGHAPANFAVRRKFTPNYGAQTPTEYGGSTQRYPRSVQQFPVINNDDPEKAHPTQKPVGMLEYFIRTYSKPGDTVLDFTMGSGSTGVACKRLDRRFIGIDENAEYVAIAKSRIANDAGPLFAGAA